MAHSKVSKTKHSNFHGLLHDLKHTYEYDIPSSIHPPPPIPPRGQGCQIGPDFWFYYNVCFARLWVALLYNQGESWWRPPPPFHLQNSAPSQMVFPCSVWSPVIHYSQQKAHRILSGAHPVLSIYAIEPGLCTVRSTHTVSVQHAVNQTQTSFCLFIHEWIHYICLFVSVC